jgi:hypothetical protein
VWPGLLLAGALSAVALTATACSSSNSAATTTTAQPNPATAKADIGAVYQSLFNFADKSIGDKVAAVQDGAALRQGLSEAMASNLSSSASGARIDAMTLLSSSQCAAHKVPAPCATVTYDILAGNGVAVLPNQTGYATFVSGKWQVAKVTICGLLEAFYGAEQKKGIPPGCAS